jgi:hypothetical protein
MCVGKIRPFSVRATGGTGDTGNSRMASRECSLRAEIANIPRFRRSDFVVLAQAFTMIMMLMLSTLFVLMH